MRRTVLFLETSMRMGGTETVLTHLMRHMDPARFRPLLCCLYGPGVLGEKLLEEGREVVHSLGKGSWDLRIGWRLLLLLRREKVEVLFIVNQPLTQIWGTLCGLLAGVPVRVAAIRSTGKVSRVGRRRWVNRLTFPLMTRITALSRTHKDYLVKEERIPAAQIEIVTNGVDLSRFSGQGGQAAVRGPLGLPEGAPVAGIVAMLRPEKNHEMFLRAAARVAREIPAARFLLVGDGPQRSALEGLAAELGIPDRVLFLGTRQDVPALLALFDVAVLCSHPVVETLSNAVLEYMAAGKPVVATRVGSLAEQVEEGKTGFLVDPGDEAGLAERVTRLLRDPETARRMGQAGKERARAVYALEAMVSQTQDLFDRLLAGRGGQARCA